MNTKILSADTSINTHEVLHPRYSRYDVLVPADKVGEHNRIKFTKAKSLKDEEYYFSGKRYWMKESDGHDVCAVIPLDKLQRLVIKENAKGVV